MSYYWITFNGREAASIDAATEEFARQKAAAITGSEVVDVTPLPYPAKPQLAPTSCPPFCYSPQQCKGRTACPKNYACSE